MNVSNEGSLVLILMFTVHGISYGAAIDLSTCCDIRLCAKDTIFSVREVAIGLAADLGTLTRLGHTGVPMSWIKDVCLTARDFDAQEALSMGFVSGVYESKTAAVERAMVLAKDIAAASPVAVQSTKAVINYSRDHTVADGESFWKVASDSKADVPRRTRLCSCMEFRDATDAGREGCLVQQEGKESSSFRKIVDLDLRTYLYPPCLPSNLGHSACKKKHPTQQQRKTSKYLSAEVGM